jgi:hypothetical protein
MNRYFDTTVDNTPAEDTDGYDIEMFPIEEVVKPLRPTKGAAKAMVGAAMIADVYTDANMPRFYVASTDDKYKYWVSPERSSGTASNPTDPQLQWRFPITDCQPFVIYEKNLNVNKVVVKLENTWASPADWYIDYTTVASPASGDWSRLATNPTIRNDGQVILYWNGTAWSSTKPTSIAATRDIRGLRITVNSMGAGKTKDGTTTQYLVWNEGANPATGVYEEKYALGGNSHFSLIEISARLEIDISDKLLSVGTNLDSGEVSQLTPMGNITTNVADMELWDADGLFDKDNEASPYYDLIEPNGLVDLWYEYYLNGTTYKVQEARMYVGDFSPTNAGTVSVSLEDHSKFLKEDTVPAMMYENITLTEVVYRVMDAVGFTDYTITQIDNNDDFAIPVWWTNGEETAWEVLQRLAIDTQSLVYFDSFGVLNIKQRRAAFDPDRAVDWTLLGTKRGNDLADIIEMQKSGQYEANKITVMYSYTRWSKWNNGQPSMTTVWEPEDTLALRACPLAADLDDTETGHLRIAPKDAKIFPYETNVNIEGEVIKTDAKRYHWHSGTETAPVTNAVWLKSHEDFEKYNEMTPQEVKHLNGFNGMIRIKERGVWNSRVRDHSNKPKTYSVRRLVAEHNITSNRGYRHNSDDSSITLHSAGVLTRPRHRLLMTTGSAGVVGDYKHYGTRLRFEKGDGYTDQIAGLVFNNVGSNEDGYYIELTPTNKLDADDRAVRNEVSFYVRKLGADNKMQRRLGCTPLDLGSQSSVREASDSDNASSGSTEGGGDNNDSSGWAEETARQAVAVVQEYDIDVRISETSSGKHHVRVWINGREKLNTYVKAADTIAMNTKFGVYIRGKTKATFDYLYAVRDHANLKEPLDDQSFFDRVRGGYYGTYASHEIPYSTSSQTLIPKRKSNKRANSKPDFYFDEFGAQVQEVREFSVKFSEAPTLHNRLFMTNDWSASVLEYRSTPFSADFIIAATSRQNAVIHGTESLVMGGGERDVEHVTNVIGRTLEVDEAKEHVVKNEDQIRARGEIETQIESTWIQSEAAAKIVGEWITDFWSTGQDEVSATVFGNPLFEIGDLVEVDYPKKNMEPANNRYFITSVSNDFTSGIETTLVMRRVTYGS